MKRAGGTAWRTGLGLTLSNPPSSPALLLVICAWSLLWSRVLPPRTPQMLGNHESHRKARKQGGAASKHEGPTL